MGIKVKVEVKTVQIKESGYPFIGIVREDGLVVLFTKPAEGTVLMPGNTTHEIGYWNGWWAMENFEELTGSITLSNE